MLFAQKFVEFVRGLEFLLEFFTRKARPKMVDGLREAIERARNVFIIGEENVAPNGVGASREPQNILKAWPRKTQRQAGLVGFILNDARQRHGQKLRQMRDDADGPVVRFRIAPGRLRANGENQLPRNTLPRWVAAFSSDPIKT